MRFLKSRKKNNCVVCWFSNSFTYLMLCFLFFFFFSPFDYLLRWNRTIDWCKDSLVIFNYCSKKTYSHSNRKRYTTFWQRIYHRHIYHKQVQCDILNAILLKQIWSVPISSLPPIEYSLRTKFYFHKNGVPFVAVSYLV